MTDFDSWRDIVEAGFPAYEESEGEAPADHRTEKERQTDRARALAALGEIASDQLALFPLDRYEPTEATLKELAEYATDQEELTARFVEHGRKRRTYLDGLIEAVDGDLSTTWQDAHRRAHGEDVAS